MIITDVRIKELENAGKLLAVATIVLDNCFAVRDIRILDGRNGLYIAFPSIRVKEHHKDLAHPIDAKTRESMTMEILKRYEALKMTEIYDHYEDNKNYALKHQEEDWFEEKKNWSHEEKNNWSYWDKELKKWNAKALPEQIVTASNNSATDDFITVQAPENNKKLEERHYHG